MKSSVYIKQVPIDDFQPFVETMFLSAGRPVDEEFLTERKEVFIPERSLAAYSGNNIVGTIATRPLEMTIPGGNKIPVAAIGQGGVLPSYTRQGIMRELMTKSLEEAKLHEEPATVWTTSEWPLYGRFGGGVSSFKAEYQISRNRVKIQDQYSFDGKTLLVGLDVARKILPQIHLEASFKIPGGVARDSIFWNNIFRRITLGKSLDVLDYGNPFPPALAALYQNTSGKYEGGIIFRIINNWEDGLSHGQIQVLFFVHTTQMAYISLWAFLLGFDLIETINLPHRPVNEELRWIINDGRRLLTKAIYDDIWFRVLDATTCLRNRRFPKMEQPIRIKITDSMGFVETATIEIFSDGEKTQVQQTKNRPHVTMDIISFSSIFMGGVSIWEYVKIGKVEGDIKDTLQLASILQSFSLPFTDTSF